MIKITFLALFIFFVSLSSTFVLQDVAYTKGSEFS